MAGVDGAPAGEPPSRRDDPGDTVTRDDIVGLSTVLCRFYQQAPTVPIAPIRLPAPLWAGCAHEPRNHHPACPLPFGGRGPLGRWTNRPISWRTMEICWENEQRKGGLSKGMATSGPSMSFWMGSRRSSIVWNSTAICVCSILWTNWRILGLECERLGAPWIGQEILDNLQCAKRRRAGSTPSCLLRRLSRQSAGKARGPQAG